MGNVLSETCEEAGKLGLNTMLYNFFIKLLSESINENSFFYKSYYHDPPGFQCVLQEPEVVFAAEVVFTMSILVQDLFILLLEQQVFFSFFLNTDFCFLIQNLLVNQYVKEKGEKSLDVESGTKEDGSSIHVQSPSDKDGNGEDGRLFIVKIFNLQ